MIARALLLCTALLGCERRVESKTVPRAPVSAQAGAPSRFEVFSALLASGDLELAKAAHCEGVIGEDAGPSPRLGQWIAYNLSVLEKGTIELPVRCVGASAGWDCRVEFSVRNDAENVLWTWGVRFLLGADRALDRKSVTCIGAG